MKAIANAYYWKFRKHLWPVRINRVIFLWRRLRHRWQCIHQESSEINGNVSIWDIGPERRMVFNHQVESAQSMVFTRGSWAEVHREYWGQIIRPPVEIPGHPKVLMLGLGGGTLVHLIHQRWSPEKITVVEIDPIVAKVARNFMGINDIPKLEVIISDARSVLKSQKGIETYDMIIDDYQPQGFPSTLEEDERAYLSEMASLLAPGGLLVFNRFFKTWLGHKVDAGQDRLEHLLQERFGKVTRKQVEQRWLNELLFASGLRQS